MRSGTGAGKFPQNQDKQGAVGGKRKRTVWSPDKMNQ